MVSAPAPCEDGYTNAGTKCYKVLDDKKRNLQQAKAECEKDGNPDGTRAELLTVQSTSQISAIITALSLDESHGFWTSDDLTTAFLWDSDDWNLGAGLKCENSGVVFNFNTRASLNNSKIGLVLAYDTDNTDHTYYISRFNKKYYAICQLPTTS